MDGFSDACVNVMSMLTGWTQASPVGGTIHTPALSCHLKASWPMISCVMGHL